MTAVARRLPDVVGHHGASCAAYEWTPTTPPRGLVLIFHGLGAHANFPSVRIAAEALAAHGFLVFGLDQPGHGMSKGLRGYLPSAECVIECGLAGYRAAVATHAGLPTFLLGTSMGGAIAIAVADRAAKEAGLPAPWGLVLLAPMLAPAASPLKVALVTFLARLPCVAPLALIPSSATSSDDQYADPEIRREIDEDTLAYKGKLRIGSAAAVLDLGRQTEAALSAVRTPFLCCIAERERVLGPLNREAQERLVRAAATPSARRAVKRYDTLHGILCEPPAKRAEIVDDIVAWLLEGVAAGPP